jgi:hypothetical protein
MRGASCRYAHDARALPPASDAAAAAEQHELAGERAPHLAPHPALPGGCWALPPRSLACVPGSAGSGVHGRARAPTPLGCT